MECDATSAYEKMTSVQEVIRQAGIKLSTILHNGKPNEDLATIHYDTTSYMAAVMK